MIVNMDVIEMQSESILIETVESPIRANHDHADLSPAELRRLMYERIAQGNALAEVEEKADYKWHNR